MEPTSHAIDFIFLLCLGWGAYKGFRKGFIKQSFMILALVVAIWGSFVFAGRFEPFMQKHFQVSDVACHVASFIAVFLLILILISISGNLLSKVADIIALGLINRLAGAVFGVFTNVLILSALVLLFNRVNDKKHFIKPETLEKTYLFKPIGKVASAIFPEKFFSPLLNKGLLSN